MQRREFLKSAGSFLGLAAVGGFSGCMNGVMGKASKTPNIIYIMADDMGYGDLGCYGQTVLKTPNIDRLAAEGMRFTQHYAGDTVCAPSRCVLMTGLHTGHARVRGNKLVPLLPEDVTVAGKLKEAGYATGMFGKWGLGEPGTTGEPRKQGFDQFYGYLNQAKAHNYFPAYLWRNEEKVELGGKEYSHDLIMAEAKKFIRANADGRFFCYLPVTIPHASMQAPKALHDKWRKALPEYEDRVGRYAGPDVVNPVAGFAAMIEHLDNGVGEIMAMLKELGIDKDTIVMFTSDNGTHAEGGHDPKIFDSNGPLRGIKRDLYEGGIRTPFIVRWPGKVEAGSVTDLISGFQDFLPTCVELAGETPMEGLDGVSMVPTLLGKKGQEQHAYLYWEFFERGGRQAVRKGKWKAVRLNVKKKPNGPIELYDLDADLGETRDVAKAHPEVVKEMELLMKSARTENKDFRF